MSEKIIPIELVCESHDHVKFVITSSLISCWGHCAVEEIDTVHVVVGLPKTMWNKIELIDNIWEAREHIVFPISSTISNDETLNVISCFVFDFSDNVMLVDLPCQIRSIDTTITFTRDEKRVWLESIKEYIEFFKCSKSIFRSNHIIIDHFFLGYVPWGESNTSW